MDLFLNDLDILHYVTFLLQPPVEFEKLGEPQRHAIQGAMLGGLCCGDNKLYCMERWGRDSRNCLTAYHISRGHNMNSSFSLLDRTQVEHYLSLPTMPSVTDTAGVCAMSW